MLVIYQNLGLGHLKRCQVIVENLNLSVKYCTTEEFINNPIESNFYLIDAYNFPEKLEKKLYQKAKIMIISDFIIRKRYCDYLLDYSNQDEKIYNNLIPENCKCFMGIKYFPINKNFPKHGWKYKSSNKNLLITLGGLDPNNYLIKILTENKNILITFNLRIIIGGLYKFTNEIKAFFVNYSGKYEIKKTEKLWEDYLWCDWCIGAFGVSSFERLWMNIPSLNIKIADNQNVNKKYFLKNNLTCKFNINYFLKKKKLFYKNANNHFKNHLLSKLKISLNI